MTDQETIAVYGTRADEYAAMRDNYNGADPIIAAVATVRRTTAIAGVNAHQIAFDEVTGEGINGRHLGQFQPVARPVHPHFPHSDPVASGAGIGWAVAHRHSTGAFNRAKAKRGISWGVFIPVSLAKS
ncbi:MAG: hypothetical protein GDA36_13540 [Rhodobacteraceae bacterium]|nr:hypothetical protein [Paracoccaceae bacterium]